MIRKPHISERQQRLKVLLKKGRSRPGVSEYMDIYNAWQEQDRHLDPYRLATADIVKITTTDHANDRSRCIEGAPMASRRSMVAMAPTILRSSSACPMQD